MNHFFTMSQNDPHNICFAFRMSCLILGLGVVLIFTIVGTLMFLGWREHRRYMREREEKRAQHVKMLMEEAQKRDRLLFSVQSSTQTMPDMFGDQRIVEEAFREFR
jgi:hypothetical protein